MVVSFQTVNATQTWVIFFRFNLSDMAENEVSMSEILPWMYIIRVSFDVSNKF